MAYFPSTFVGTGIIYRDSSLRHYSGTSSDKVAIPVVCPFTAIDVTATIVPKGTGVQFLVTYGYEWNAGFSLALEHSLLKCSIMSTSVYSGSLPNNVESTVRMTWDGTTLTCSINGDMVRFKATSTHVIPCSTELWIGGEQYRGGRYWYQGATKEIVVLNKRLGILEMCM